MDLPGHGFGQEAERVQGDIATKAIAAALVQFIVSYKDHLHTFNNIDQAQWLIHEIHSNHWQ